MLCPILCKAGPTYLWSDVQIKFAKQGLVHNTERETGISNSRNLFKRIVYNNVMSRCTQSIPSDFCSGVQNKFTKRGWVKKK